MGAIPKVVEALADKASIVKPQTVVSTVKGCQLSYATFLLVSMRIDVPPNECVKQEVIMVDITA